MIKIKYLFLIPCLLLLVACAEKQGSADWRYSFVVWEGKMYTFNNPTETLEANEIGKEIGNVEQYSDNEAANFNSAKIFSNRFKEGSKLFEINELSSDLSIAVKDYDGLFIKGNYEGKYGK
ncbi:hypothetical protein [Paenibacillus montanisoli]|uniref:hypothetical protein n=1 Tax=Paenibacillus montanisoli TaxID=2081970 RepID=UPI0010578490|nr:hypothetical protein [Paenibacillus montanisoli]